MVFREATRYAGLSADSLYYYPVSVKQLLAGGRAIQWGFIIR